MNACSITRHMTENEIKIIENGDYTTPFRVLKIDNTEDLAFLRQKSTDIPNVSNIAKNLQLQILIQRLKLTMLKESGVGIAAPQIGISRNLFIFIRLDKPDYPMEVAINPRITKHSEETICFEGDGCLSVPDQSGTTNRYAWIEVEYYNEKGELVKDRLSGESRDGDFTGVIFQHEYDHLQGILFYDRLSEQPLNQK